MPVLLHVGPHDTGGPMIQAALRAARNELAAHDIRFFGPARVDAARGATADRVVISSESLGESDDDTARTLVRDLGGGAVHVVITLRPLAMILPVAWQRFVCNQLTATYDEWLDSVLHSPETTPTPTFWQSHRHDDLVERWSSVVGPEHLTVIAAGPHDDLLASFEQVADLPRGLLAPPTDVPRPLTAAEVELVRAINVEFQERDWTPERYQRNIRNGVIPGMQRREALRDEPVTATPAWAIARANEIAAAAAGRIAHLGVRTVGDLSGLSAVAMGTGSAAPVERLDLDVASQAIIGAVDAAARRWKIGPAS